MFSDYIYISSLPVLTFAHTFFAEKYHNIIHSCPQRIEISYISAGGYHIKQDDFEYSLKSGDVLCNTYTSDLQIDTENFHSHHTVCFDMPFIVKDEKIQNFISLQNRISLSTVIPAVSCDKEITFIIDRIIAECTINSTNNLLYTGLFLQLLDIINKCSQEQHLNVRSSDIRYVEKAKKYVFNNLNRPIKQAEVAAALEISPEYLSTVFKKVEGKTLMTYINQTKLEKIRYIIKKENLKLYQAAEMFGYSDPNYVSYMYKKYFHMNITDKNRK